MAWTRPFGLFLGTYIALWLLEIILKPLPRKEIRQ